MRCFILVVLFCSLVFAGCASRPPENGAVPDGSCLLRGPDVSSSGERYRVAVQSDQLRAPTAATLIDVDCHGRLRAGLADVPSGKGRRHVLSLREGGMITARAVARAWSDAIAGGGGVDSVRALDDRRLEVFLEQPTLTTLASPDFSIETRNEGRWLVVDVSRSDPRDALAVTDLMVTGDSAVAEYAAGLGRVTASLPFDRTFVLLVPGTRGAPRLTDDAQADLVAAVRAASARASATPAWWMHDIAGCGELSSLPGWRITEPHRTGPPCVYFDAGDPVARDLAERIVALAAMDITKSESARAMVSVLGGDAETIPMAKGVAAGEMSDRLERGDGFAFVTSVRNPVPDACGSARKLLRRAPWLAAGSSSIAGPVIPLVDTHGYVILAKRDVAVTWDIYGTVRIVATEQP